MLHHETLSGSWWQPWITVSEQWSVSAPPAYAVSEIPSPVWKCMHGTPLLPKGGNERNCNAVIWFVYLFIYFYLICCFPLSNVNNTWKIQEKIWEDGCCVWVRETLLLPSSWSWSSCTHTTTSGAYVTLGQKDARSSPRSSDVLICDTISTCFYLTVLSPHGRAHTLTEMSSQAAHLCEEWIGHHLCVWVLEVKELLTKKSMCVWEFNRKQRGRRVIYRKQFQSGEWPFTVHFVH